MSKNMYQYGKEYTDKYTGEKVVLVEVHLYTVVIRHYGDSEYTKNNAGNINIEVIAKSIWLEDFTPVKTRLPKSSRQKTSFAYSTYKFMYHEMRFLKRISSDDNSDKGSFGDLPFKVSQFIGNDIHTRDNAIVNAIRSFLAR